MGSWITPLTKTASIWIPANCLSKLISTCLLPLQSICGKSLQQLVGRWMNWSLRSSIRVCRIIDLDALALKNLSRMTRWGSLLVVAVLLLDAPFQYERSKIAQGATLLDAAFNDFLIHAVRDRDWDPFGWANNVLTALCSVHTTCSHLASTVTSLYS